MVIREVVKVLDGKMICGEEFLDREIESGCGCDLMSHVLAFVKNDNSLLLTGLTAPQTIFICDAVNIQTIGFVRGKMPGEEVVKLAKERKMVLFGVALPLYEACGKLYNAGLGGCSEYEQ
jgi:hypothetical protein